MSPQLFYMQNLWRGKQGISEQGQSTHLCMPGIQITENAEDGDNEEKRKNSIGRHENSFQKGGEQNIYTFFMMQMENYSSPVENL